MVVNNSSNTNKVGTYCIVIEKQIITSSCPLPTGTCIWKHRTTGTCKYDLAISPGITPSALCERIGLELPTEAQLTSIKDGLLQAVKAVLY